MPTKTMPRSRTVGRPRHRIRLKVDALMGWLKVMGWTQHRLAVEVGISPTQMSDVITGKRRAGGHFVAAMMAATKTPFDFFFQVVPDGKR